MVEPFEVGRWQLWNTSIRYSSLPLALGAKVHQTEIDASQQRSTDIQYVYARWSSGVSGWCM